TVTTLSHGGEISDVTPFDSNTSIAAYTRTNTAQLGSRSTLTTYITDPGKQIVVKDPGTVVMDLGTPVPRFDLLLASQYGTGIVNPNVSTKGKDQGTSTCSRTRPGPAPTWSRARSPTTRSCWCATRTTGAAGAGRTSIRS